MTKVVVSNIFFEFLPLPGKNDPNLTCAYFSSGLVQPPPTVTEKWKGFTMG